MRDPHSWESFLNGSSVLPIDQWQDGVLKVVLSRLCRPQKDHMAKAFILASSLMYEGCNLHHPLSPPMRLNGRLSLPTALGYSSYSLLGKRKPRLAVGN